MPCDCGCGFALQLWVRTCMFMPSVQLLTCSKRWNHARHATSGHIMPSFSGRLSILIPTLRVTFNSSISLLGSAGRSVLAPVASLWRCLAIPADIFSSGSLAQPDSDSFVRGFVSLWLQALAIPQFRTNGHRQASEARSPNSIRPKPKHSCAGMITTSFVV